MTCTFVTNAYGTGWSDSNLPARHSLTADATAEHPEGTRHTDRLVDAPQPNPSSSTLT